ncbi:MAG TPA: DUF4382 domain-containing protein [Steroidobacteraceae bacterium]|nr:DUF4382 domain-containing protein [Steroidobacteraceae bacterium]
MVSNKTRWLGVSLAAAVLAACSGGGSGGSSMNPPNSAPQSTPLPIMISDASTEDWATIGVKILSIALVPQGGGSNVTVYTAPSPAPVVNLAQLDQIAEILGNVTVPTGTYTAAVLTISANSGDILLTVAADPESGFAAAPGATIPASQIQIQHTQGAAPNLTVPVNVNFVSPLVVSTTQSNALDLEFDLAHPAFIVGHVPPGTGTTQWAVNFNGPVRHHPLYGLSHLVLRHTYGDVTAIASDNGSITITKEFPTEPAVNPETAIATTQSLQILADNANGTLFFDVDAKTRTVIKDFSAESSLTGKFVRIAARYQDNGTLVATRIWASSQFNNVWLSPEGHVLHVNTGTDVVTVASESGGGVDLVVDGNTQFFFRQPENGLADATPIATGTAFLTNHDLVRGFKVHASVVDPLATPWVAQTIDIEAAKYDGTISGADMTGFTYTRAFRTASDDYSITLNYIDGATANGTDPMGNPITGYQWWNFAYPTVVTSGMNAVSDFIAATNGSVNFGGSVGAVPSRGISFARWNDPANANGWSASATILTPSLLPLGFVATGLVGNSFTMTIPGGANAPAIDVSSTSGSATLVYQVDMTNGVLTVSPIDITTTNGLAALTSGLTAGEPVKVYGVPQSDGSLKAYMMAYYTGDLPAQ